MSVQRTPWRFMLTYISTDDEFATYISANWFPGASLSDLDKVLQLYPSDPAAGSPFDTGAANAFTPEYKRIAALQGDWFFHAPRRLLLDTYASTHTTYNFRKFIWPPRQLAQASRSFLDPVSARGTFSGIGIVSCTTAAARVETVLTHRACRLTSPTCSTCSGLGT